MALVCHEKYAAKHLAPEAGMLLLLPLAAGSRHCVVPSHLTGSAPYDGMCSRFEPTVFARAVKTASDQLVKLQCGQAAAPMLQDAGAPVERWNVVSTLLRSAACCGEVRDHLLDGDFREGLGQLAADHPFDTVVGEDAASPLRRVGVGRWFSLRVLPQQHTTQQVEQGFVVVKRIVHDRPTLGLEALEAHHRAASFVSTHHRQPARPDGHAQRYRASKNEVVASILSLGGELFQEEQWLDEERSVRQRGLRHGGDGADSGSDSDSDVNELADLPAAAAAGSAASAAASPSGLLSASITVPPHSEELLRAVEAQVAKTEKAAYGRRTLAQLEAQLRREAAETPALQQPPEVVPLDKARSRGGPAPPLELSLCSRLPPPGDVGA
jgi:hypothetical protein